MISRRARRDHRENNMDLNEISGIIIGAAITVHRELGPGLLETTYETCLAYELTQRGVNVERQKALPLKYRGVHLDCGYRTDLLVENTVIVELKVEDSLQPIHEAQLLSYLKLSNRPLGSVDQFQCQRAQARNPSFGKQSERMILSAISAISAVEGISHGFSFPIQVTSSKARIFS